MSIYLLFVNIRKFWAWCLEYIQKRRDAGFQYHFCPFASEIFSHSYWIQDFSCLTVHGHHCQILLILYRSPWGNSLWKGSSMPRVRVQCLVLGYFNLCSGIRRTWSPTTNPKVCRQLLYQLIHSCPTQSRQCFNQAPYFFTFCVYNWAEKAFKERLCNVIPNCTINCGKTTKTSKRLTFWMR